MKSNQGSDVVFSTLWDVCIVGSGAMGLALALALTKGGKKVLMVEAGGRDVTEESQDVYKCEVAGHRYDGGSNGRFRVLGGSTERWGGQAMRFEPADFAPRPGIFSEGWPVSLEEVEPFYPAAEAFMGVPEPRYEEFGRHLECAAARCGVDVEKLRAAASSFQLHYSVFTTEPRLREAYKARLEGTANLHTLIDAPAEKLVTDEAGNITGLTFRRVGGGPETVRARHFILACGCIENARFLLVQRDVHKVNCLQGVPMLGKCLQDHPGAHLGELEFAKNGAFLQDLFRLKQRGGMGYKARVSWSGEKRIRQGLMAVSGTLLLLRQKSDFDDRVSAARHPARSFGNWTHALRLLTKGMIYSPVHRAYLGVSAEDARYSQSEIRLSNTQVDRNGVPRPVVEWKIAPAVADSILAYIEEFERFLASCRLGSLSRFEFTKSPEALLARLQDNSHQIGSTSMGVDAMAGVVDNRLKVFGTNNLYVTGTSVLPTGSHANPTLTALALAIRLAVQLGAPSGVI